MIVYDLLVHKKSVWKRKVCIIFIKNKKFEKPPKKTFLVGFFRWVFLGYFGWVFLRWFFNANTAARTPSIWTPTPTPPPCPFSPSLGAWPPARRKACWRAAGPGGWAWHSNLRPMGAWPCWGRAARARPWSACGSGSWRASAPGDSTRSHSTLHYISIYCTVFPIRIRIQDQQNRRKS